MRGYVLGLGLGLGLVLVVCLRDRMSFVLL